MANTTEQALKTNLEWSAELQKRLIAQGEDEEFEIRNLMAEAACCLASFSQSLTAAPQASQPNTLGDMLKESGLDAYIKEGDLAHAMAAANFASMVRRKALEQASQPIGQPESLGEWIDVTKRLPERGQRIQGLSRSGAWIETFDPDEPLGHMTHWRAVDDDANDSTEQPVSAPQCKHAYTGNSGDGYTCMFCMQPKDSPMVEIDSQPVSGAMTDAEINDITMQQLGKWPSFEAQSWACKVVHAVFSAGQTEAHGEQVGSTDPALELTMLRATRYDETHGITATLRNDRIEELEAQQTEAPVNVPSGWKLVPTNPTTEMEIAGEAAYDKWQNGHCVPEVYASMLAAAPVPVQTQQSEKNAEPRERYCSTCDQVVSEPCSSGDCSTPERPWSHMTPLEQAIDHARQWPKSDEVQMFFDDLFIYAETIKSAIAKEKAKS